MSKDINTAAKVVYVCTGGKCKKKGSKEISKLLQKYADDHDLHHVDIIKTHCTDNCKHGPVVCFQPENAWHFHVDETKAVELLKRYR